MKVTIEDKIRGRYLPLWLKITYFASVAFLLTIAIGSAFIQPLYNFFEIPTVLIALGLYCILLGSELQSRQNLIKNADWFKARKRSVS